MYGIRGFEDLRYEKRQREDKERRGVTDNT